MFIALSKSVQRYPCWDGSHNCKIKPQNKKLVMLSQNTLNKINCCLIFQLGKSGAVESKLHRDNCHRTNSKLGKFGESHGRKMGPWRSSRGEVPPTAELWGSHRSRTPPPQALAGCLVTCLPFGEAGADMLLATQGLNRRGKDSALPGRAALDRLSPAICCSVT